MNEIAQNQEIKLQISDQKIIKHRIYISSNRNLLKWDRHWLSIPEKTSSELIEQLVLAFLFNNLPHGVSPADGDRKFDKSYKTTYSWYFSSDIDRTLYAYQMTKYSILIIVDSASDSDLHLRQLANPGRLINQELLNIDKLSAANYIKTHGSSIMKAAKKTFFEQWKTHPIYALRELMFSKSEIEIHEDFYDEFNLINKYTGFIEGRIQFLNDRINIIDPLTFDEIPINSSFSVSYNDPNMVTVIYDSLNVWAEKREKQNGMLYLKTATNLFNLSNNDFSDLDAKALAQRMIRGEIFTNYNIRPCNSDLLYSIFIPLCFASKELIDYYKDIEVTLFYEDISKAGPSSINGYPIFFSFNVLNKKNANKVLEYYHKIQKMMNELD